MLLDSRERWGGSARRTTTRLWMSLSSLNSRVIHCGVLWVSPDTQIKPDSHNIPPSNYCHRATYVTNMIGSLLNVIGSAQGKSTAEKRSLLVTSRQRVRTYVWWTFPSLSNHVDSSLVIIWRLLFWRCDTRRGCLCCPQGYANCIHVVVASIGQSITRSCTIKYSSLHFSVECLSHRDSATASTFSHFVFLVFLPRQPCIWGLAVIVTVAIFTFIVQYHHSQCNTLKNYLPVTM